MMQMTFTKMHGLGNDFVVIDTFHQKFGLAPAQIRWIADRRLGVGCDQLLCVSPPVSKDADFQYRIFNADGSEAQQCGNGARCFLRYVRDKGLTDKTEVRVQTLAGIITLLWEDDGQVAVDMGIPEFEPRKIPFDATQQAPLYALKVGTEYLQLGAVSMGNPHAVLEVEDIAQADVGRLGPLIESHEAFPQRVNAGFMQILTAEHIRLRVYERGAGETRACGSGACAAMAVAYMQGKAGTRVAVELPGGVLIIRWQGPGTSVWMTGPAETVYEGVIEL